MTSILDLAKKHSKRLTRVQAAKHRRGPDDDPFSPGRMEFRRRMDKNLAEDELKFFEAWARSVQIEQVNGH